MGARLRGLTAIVVVAAVGAFVGSALSQWTGTEAQASPEERGDHPPGERIRVEVLNGGGRTGMARRATRFLRGAGYDVVGYGNHTSQDNRESVVLDRVGRPDLARSVADAMGIPRVRTEPDSNLYLDVTVILGRAWDPPPEPPAEGPEPAWWDLRRFFDETPGPAPGTPGGRLVDPGEGEG